MKKDAAAKPGDDRTILDALASAEWLDEGAASSAPIDEVDLAVVAERGLRAISESRREAVASYIATHPTAARVVLETRRAVLETSETLSAATQASLPVESFRERRRTLVSGWWMAAPSSIAALVAIGSSIVWLNSQPTVDRGLRGLDLGPNVTETPVLPGIEETPILTNPVEEELSHNDHGVDWRLVTITAGVAAVVFSPLLCIAISRRSRKKAGSTA